MGAPGAASSTCRGRRGSSAARKGQRLFRRRAAPCQARPARRPGGPRRRPPCVCFAGRACTGRTASGRRRPPCDPARPTSSATSGATAPFSVSPGQLRWPRLFEPGWTGLWRRPQVLVHRAPTLTCDPASADGTCLMQPRVQPGRGGEIGGGRVGQNFFQVSLKGSG